MPTVPELRAAISALKHQIAMLDINGETDQKNTLLGALRDWTDAVEARAKTEAEKQAAWERFLRTEAARHQGHLEKVRDFLDRSIKTAPALGFNDLEQASAHLLEILDHLPRPNPSRTEEAAPVPRRP